MMSISGWALIELLLSNIRSQQWALCFASGFLLVMAAAIIFHAFHQLLSKKKGIPSWISSVNTAFNHWIKF